MERSDFTILYLVYKKSCSSYRVLANESGFPIKRVASICNNLSNKGLVKDHQITQAGRKALSPYKVKTAIIMAAGMSSRFAPISYEKPKGLLVVKDEVLIERQINQLLEVGIKNIILVLGYKKEAFSYLKKKYPFIKIVINTCYNTKNNIYTLYLVRKYLDRAYICSSDDYFTVNPFDDYVYEAYYAGHYAKEKTDEFYMEMDKNGYINKIYIGGSKANIMFGHAYFDEKFAKAFVRMMEQKIKEYDQKLWDVMLMNNLKRLPPMYGKLYPYGVINEFDSLEDLRKFDSKYINHTDSKIMKYISKTLKCKEGEITNFSNVKKDPTKYSFNFSIKKEHYTYKCFENKHKVIISKK